MDDGFNNWATFPKSLRRIAYHCSGCMGPPQLVQRPEAQLHSCRQNPTEEARSLRTAKCAHLLFPPRSPKLFHPLHSPTSPIPSPQFFKNPPLICNPLTVYATQHQTRDVPNRLWIDRQEQTHETYLTLGSAGERSLQEVIHRIRNSRDAEMALKAAELFRRYRASREQHTPFKCSTSKLIIQVDSLGQ